MIKEGTNDRGAGDTTGFREIKVELDQEAIDELNSIHDKLSSGEDSRDIQTKRRLAQALIGIIEDNSLSKAVISRYAKLISRFSKFTFADELDNILADNSDIMNNSQSKDSEVISMWKDMHDKLTEYLSKS